MKNFTIFDEPARAHHYHPVSVVCYRAHACSFTICDCKQVNNITEIRAVPLLQAAFSFHPLNPTEPFATTEPLAFIICSSYNDIFWELHGS